MATAPALPADIATALRYGPQTQQAARRSSYLADALKELSTSGSKNIQSYGELGAKLLATAILNRSMDKAQAATLAALKGEQDRETSGLLAALRPPEPTQPDPAPAPPAAPELIKAPDFTPGPAPQAAPVGDIDPRSLDALARMGLSEAGHEGPEGMAAAMHTAVNRLRSGYGGAKTLEDVVYAPHQFEGMTTSRAKVDPSDPGYQMARDIAARVMRGEMPDPTGGAVNFINPELQVQLGREIPSWAKGQGLRIGRHVFFGHAPSGPALAAGGPPPPSMPPQDMAPPPAMPDPSIAGAGAEPFPAAPQGAAPPAPIPSAAPVPAVGATPVAGGPQATATGVQHAPVTPEEIAFAEQLLRDPQRHEEGVAYAMSLRKRAVEPVKQEFVTVNSVPGVANPYTGEYRLLPVPDQAKTRLATPEQLNMPGRPGTIVQQTPLGNTSVVMEPAAGQMVVSAPGAPYKEAPVTGGMNSPNSPSATVANERQLRSEYDPYLKAYSEARNGYEKVLSAARDGTGASDIALIFGFMKTLDPTSTVREGEFATAQNSGSIDQTVANMYNKVLKGERLQPEQRAQFAQTAASQFAVAQQRFDQVNDRYTKLAQSYGYDPARVVYQFPKPTASDPGSVTPGGPPAPPPPVPHPQGHAEPMRNLTPAQQRKVMEFKGSTAAPGDPANPFIVHTPEDAKRLPPGKAILLPDGTIGRVPNR